MVRHSKPLARYTGRVGCGTTECFLFIPLSDPLEIFCCTHLSRGIVCINSSMGVFGQENRLLVQHGIFRFPGFAETNLCREPGGKETLALPLTTSVGFL